MTTPAAVAPEPTRNPARTAARIAGAAGLILFLELALIRYIAAYVHVFAFYVNFVVIATFLGMGTGMLRRRNAAELLWIAGPALIVLTGFVALLAISPIDIPADPLEYFWGYNEAGNLPRHIPHIVAIIGLFALTSLLFVPFGALLGSLMARLAPLPAYAADLFGSLLGVGAFALMSRMATQPTTWFALAFVTFIVLIAGRRPLVLALTACCAVSLATIHWTRENDHEYWSPYYRITLHPKDVPGAMELHVNGVLHQVMLDFDSAAGVKVVAAIHEAYARPYQYVGRIDTALVVGAGTGNDIAVLLKLGARYIDAVEIDPLIAQIGRVAHPMHPYSDPRVHLTVTDARAFLRSPPRKYDVITFGTLDSHALLAGMSSVRLDNYVYTEESFRAARAALKPTGSLVMYHLSGLPYISARLYQTVGIAFGALPRVFGEYDYLFNFTFVAGAGSIGAAPEPKDSPLLMPIERATDSWPFPYLRDREIPSHYLGALLAVLVLAATFIGVAAGREAIRTPHWPLFFIGGGFLLLETKGITSMSLLFGSMWTVNTMVIAAILTVALAGNVLVQIQRAPSIRVSLATLGGLLALSIIFPPATLAGLAPGLRWIAAAAYVALPVLFASMIFSRVYAAQDNPTSALAYNILGAVAGGVLEYASMVVGLPALNAFVVLLYAIAVALIARQPGGTGLIAARRASA
jgi:spermidine synthase